MELSEKFEALYIYMIKNTLYYYYYRPYSLPITVHPSYWYQDYYHSTHSMTLGKHFSHLCMQPDDRQILPSSHTHMSIYISMR